MKKRMQKKQRVSVSGMFFRLMLMLVSLVGTLFLVCIALARAMRVKGLRDNIRHFNKRRFNRVALRIAGKSSRIYAAIKHVGRRSGTEYLTPVVAEPFDDGFVIPLPYGTNTDWCRNVMIAGKCTLYWNEHEYIMAKPEILPMSLAMGAFPFVQRVIFGAGGINQCLFLRVYQAEEVQERAHGEMQTAIRDGHVNAV